MTDRPHRITLLIGAMGPGGAERVLAQLANHWSGRGEHVTLMTLGSRDRDFYPLDAGIRRVALDLEGPAGGVADAVASNARRIMRVRQVVRESSADVVLSFIDRTNILVIAATRLCAARVVISERDNPFRGGLGPAWRSLRRLCYPHADAVVAQTEPVAKWLRTFVAAERVHVIPNGVAPLAAPEAGSTDDPPRKIVGLGRLEPKKGFDLLIRAFARASAEHPNWELEIGGEGPEREGLQSLARSLGVDGSVRLVGQIQDSRRFMNDSSIFALSSRYEGFPNVLLEAMATGRACVAFDCAYGPADIIRHGIDGLLVPDEDYEAFGIALGELMAEPARRRRMGDAARQVASRFSAERIFEAWDEIALGKGAQRPI